MTNSREHLEVTNHEQSTIMFLGLRDRLGGTLLRGLVNGESWLVGGSAQPGADALPAHSKDNQSANPEDTPAEGRTVILDDFLKEREEDITPEDGDDYFSTIMSVGDGEVSVVMGPDSTVYALPKAEVLAIIDGRLPDQPDPAS